MYLPGMCIALLVTAGVLLRHVSSVLEGMYLSTLAGQRCVLYSYLVCALPFSSLQVYCFGMSPPLMNIDDDNENVPVGGLMIHSGCQQ